MKRIVLQSPAKLNLFLKIVNQRPDYYHNLVTLFERIDLCDEVALTLRNDRRIRVLCDHSHVPRGRGNLAFQAARMLGEKFGFRYGVDIGIKKRIPVAAGLAGGSSNAATVLLGLNKLWGLSLKKKELLEMAKRLGSDVPFFMHHCSWGIGTQRGDEIQRISLGVKLWHILVVPRIKVYSREVFTRFMDLSTFKNKSVEVNTAFPRGKERSNTDHSVFGEGKASKMQLTKKSDDVNILTRALREKDFSKARCHLVNDLESTVVHLHPSLSKLKNRLLKGNTLGVCLSGSGPSFFGLTISKRHAESVKYLLDKTYKQVFVVKTL